MANYVQRFLYFSDILHDFKLDAILSDIYFINGYNIYKHYWIDPNGIYIHGLPVQKIDRYYAIPTVYDSETGTYIEQDRLYSTIINENEIEIGEELNVLTLIKQVYWIDDSYDLSLPLLNKLKIGSTTYNLKDTWARQEIEDIKHGGTGGITADVVAFENDTGIEVGNTVDAALETIITKLYYVAITCVLSGTGNKENYIGDIVSAPTLTWGASKIPINATLTDCTISEQDRQNKGASYNTTNNLSSDKTFTLTVNDGTKSATANVTYTFYYPYYYGLVDDTSDIDYTLLTKALDKTTSENATYTSINNYLVYITKRTLTSILDKNGFENINDFNKSTITVTLGSTNYTFNCYTSKNKITCDNFKYIFKQ